MLLSPLIRFPGRVYLSRLRQELDAHRQSRDISTANRTHWLNTKPGLTKPTGLTSHCARNITPAWYAGPDLDSGSGVFRPPERPHFLSISLLYNSPYAPGQDTHPLLFS